MAYPIVSYFDATTPFLTDSVGYRMLYEHNHRFVGSDGAWSDRETTDAQPMDCYTLHFYDGEALTLSAGTVVETHRSTSAPRALAVEELHRRFQESALWRRSKTEDHDPVDLPNRDVWFDPYYVGLYLGDGCKKNGTITVGPADQDAMSSLGTLSRWDSHGTRYLRVDGAYRALRLSGHLGWKGFFPEYVFNGEPTRLATLQGLCDSDGGVNKSQGTCQFFGGDRALVDMVRVTCWLQGWDATLNRMRRGPKDVDKFGDHYDDLWRVNFRADRPAFRLERKLRYQRPATKEGRAKRILSVEPAGIRECIGITGPSVLAGYSLKAI